MEIRPAEVADAGAVFAMLGRFAMSYEPDREAFETSFAAMLGSEDVALLVAADGGTLAGYVMAVEFATLFANGSVVQIEELFVEEAGRGAGTGRALVTAVVEWAGSRAAVEVTVPTRRAGAYYERLGFESTAEYYHRRLS
ncbi:MAG: GNAT family N-acetyltransferase [Chloroflexi bacterium]|nr:MAG: GNAT family N-acetyltransferase [Chloroflexota bacterium]